MVTTRSKTPSSSFGEGMNLKFQTLEWTGTETLFFKTTATQHSSWIPKTYKKYLILLTLGVLPLLALAATPPEAHPNNSSSPPRDATTYPTTKSLFGPYTLSYPIFGFDQATSSTPRTCSTELVRISRILRFPCCLLMSPTLETLPLGIFAQIRTHQTVSGYSLITFEQVLIWSSSPTTNPTISRSEMVFGNIYIGTLGGA